MRVIVKVLLLALLAEPLSAVTRVPEGIKKSVVFIYKQGATPDRYIPDGTGFVIAIPSPLQQGKGWLYLVTAKHVLRTNPNDLSSPLYSRVFLRLNKKSGGSEMVPVALVTSGPQQTVYVHSDETVDIAVIPIGGQELDTIDLLELPESWLSSSDDIASNQIGVGTDVFFEGMFTPYLGQQKSYPIARFGRVAMLPDEKISFMGKGIDAYLLETLAFGGNSGSPVFFYLGADRGNGSMILGPPTIKIAGVMDGCFQDLAPIAMAQPASSNNQMIPVSAQNAGIAVVIPAQKVRDILDSAALVGKRH